MSNYLYETQNTPNNYFVGSTFIGGPFNEIDQMNKQIGAKLIDLGGLQLGHYFVGIK